MEYSSISHVLLNSLSVVALLLIIAFLTYGMLKGMNMEREARLRNRRRYS